MKSEPLLSLEYNAERGDDGRKKIRDANQIAAMIMSQWVGLIFEGFTLFLCTYCILHFFFMKDFLTVSYLATIMPF